MTAPMTASALLEAVKLRTFEPDSQEAITDAEILDIAWSEMTSVIYPKLIAADAGLFATTVKLQVNSRGRVRLPGDMCGVRVYSVKAGNGETERTIRQVSPHESKNSYLSEGFYFENGELVLVNHTQIADGVTVRYPVRPGRFFVPPATEYYLYSLSASLGYVELPTPPADSFPSSDPDNGDLLSKVNFQLCTSPYTVIPAEIPFDSAGATEFTYAACPTHRQDAFKDVDFQAGDVAVLAGRVRYIPLPTECFDWLVQRTALRCLEYLGKTAQIQLLQDKLADMEAAMVSLYTPRSSGNSKFISPIGGLLG